MYLFCIYVVLDLHMVGTIIIVTVVVKGLM